MIDEKKLIEEIERLREKYDEMCGAAQMREDYGMAMMYAGKVTGLHEIKKFIMNQPKVGERIPCSKRLQEGKDYSDARCVLAITEDGDYWPAHYWNGEWVDDEWAINNVVAWMPLPELYKKEVRE